MSVEAEKEVKSPSQDEQIDWSWDRFISILAGEIGEEERQRATSYLRSSQGYSFEQLRDAINDPEHVTSWADPWLGIRLSHPWEWIQSVPRKEFDPRNPRKPEVHEELIPLDLLVAGASIVIDGDMEYPSIPFPLLEGVARLPPAKQKPIFEKWLSFDEWMGRVSYGDPFENESDIGRGSIIGRGPGGTFRASLCYFLCPHVIDKKEKRAYHDIHVGLPWVGESSPDTWTREEQDALWESVLKMLDALVREAEEGKPYPNAVRTTVRSAKGVRFREFVAVIEKPSGRSFAERATLRTLERSVLRRIPVYARGIKDPTLDISGSGDGLDMLASFEIFATMYYPEDEKKRREYVAVASSHLMAEIIPQSIAKEFPTLDLKSPECWKV